MKDIPDQTEHTRSRYDAIANVYDFMEWPIEQLLFKKWRHELWQSAEGPDVLEIGVGTGKNIPYYPDDIHVTGIDLSPAMLKRARRNADRYNPEQVKFSEMDAEHLNFSDEVFDNVISTFVFCSVPRPIKGLKEAFRVTKPGGRLHLLEHMLSHNRLTAAVMKRLDAPIHYLLGVHIARRTVENVRRAGWQIETVEKRAYGGIFRRIEAVKG